MNNQIQINNRLLNSKIERIQIDDKTSKYFNLSYFKLTINLNNANTYNFQNIDNVKIAVEFPDEKTTPPIWIKQNNTQDGCFQFPDLNYNINSSSKVFELNTIVAESIAKQSSYLIDNSNTYIILKCTDPSFNSLNDQGNYSNITNDNSYNDYKITITKKNYNLTSYITEINRALSSSDTLRSVLTNNTQVFINSQNKIDFQFEIRKYFLTQNYKLDFSGTILGEQIFNRNDILDLLSSNTTTTLFQPNISLLSTFPLDPTKPIIKVITNNNNLHRDNFSIFCDTQYNLTNTRSFYLQDLINIINTSFINYTDNQGFTPLKNTNIIFSTTSTSNTKVDLSFNINIKRTITENQYDVLFYDLSNNPTSWKTNFNLDASYNLKDIGGIIHTTKTSDTYLYYLDKTTSFDISLRNDSLLNNTMEPIRIEINGSNSNNRYSLDELFAQINNYFYSNPITYGSYIGLTNDNNTNANNDHVFIKLNINNKFTAKDYKVVFYDFNSFVKCNLGVNSVRNVSWDSTLGWILGFRLYTEYLLYNYRGISTNTIAEIVGDTTITTNLYNYFLITLDDYIQNHLNDGLVTLTPQENNATLPSYATRNALQCTVSGEILYVGNNNNEIQPGNKLTQNQIYSANQIYSSQKAKSKQYSLGPYTQDIFGFIPVKPGSNSSTYVEFGGTLQEQERIYFGPVNIHRMTIQLLNDKGEIMDLNGSDWSFSFVCEQLYQQNSI